MPKVSNLVHIMKYYSFFLAVCPGNKTQIHVLTLRNRQKKIDNQNQLNTIEAKSCIFFKTVKSLVTSHHSLDFFMTI